MFPPGLDRRPWKLELFPSPHPPGWVYICSVSVEWGCGGYFQPKLSHDRAIDSRFHESSSLRLPSCNPVKSIDGTDSDRQIVRLRLKSVESMNRSTKLT